MEEGIVGEQQLNDRF